MRAIWLPGTLTIAEIGDPARRASFSAATVSAV